MRLKRDVPKEVDGAENQLLEESAKDQYDAISTSIRDLNYKLKYFNTLLVPKILYLTL